MDPVLLGEVEKHCTMASQMNEDSAFLVFDINNVIEKVTQWKENMPRIFPYYAVKCNSDPLLLETLASLGIGFDCASKGEIETIVNLGVPVKRILYANTCKAFSHLRYAAKVKVEYMTFDNEEELIKIKQLCPTAKLLLRLKVKSSSAGIPMNDKFGCDETEVSCLLDAALKHNLPVVGVSFHVGSHNQDAHDYVMAIQMSRRVFNTAERKGIAMHILDIGGGFPGFRTNGDPRKAHFTEAAEVINKAIDQYFPSDGSYEIIAEPGRYFTTTAFTLCANIIGKNKRFVDNKEDTMYIINEGIYGLFVHTIFHHAKPLLKEMSSCSQRKPSSVWGHSCDPTDIVVKRCMLPELKLGDWILFEDMGAYTKACATRFNGFEKTEVKLVVYQNTIYQMEKITGSELSQLIKRGKLLKGF